MKPTAIGSVLALVLVPSILGKPTRTAEDPPSKRSSLPAVSVSGNAFWADGKRFFIRGIDYQPGGSSATKDPLADPLMCRRDIRYFKKLGINTIRVYSIDNSQSHDACMKELADAGIYVVADVNNNQYSINRADPHTSYNAKYLHSVFATVDMMARYDSTLALFCGNEVINDQEGSERAAPYVKAVQRDVKAYLRARDLRPVMVGYSAADVDSNRMQTAHYMNCGPDANRGDFFAFNDYSWCNSDFVTAGWNEKVKNFTGYGIPIFLSEWGCTKNRPRNFDEMASLMSENMTGVYSGGLLYEYSNEENEYGVVEMRGKAVSELDEFELYRRALSDNPPPSGDGGASSTSAAAPCPPTQAGWQVDPSLLPKMPAEAEILMKSGAGQGPGLDGSGSQQAGDSGTSTTVIADSEAAGGGGSPRASSTDSGHDNGSRGTHGSLGWAALLMSGAVLLFTSLGAILL